MTAPAAEIAPLAVRFVPGQPYTVLVRSERTQQDYAVDWAVLADGRFTTKCECEAQTFHPTTQCKHGKRAEEVIRATKEFQTMTQQPKPDLAVVRHKDDIEIEQAIANIYKEVGYVQKGGRISEGPAKYTYAGEADIIEALRPAMAAHGVTVRVAAIRDVVHETITIGKFDSKMQRTTLVATVRFAHGPSGTYVDCEALGEGMDSGDKSSNKAMTGALKYALRQTFCLETGDDPDASRPELDRDAPPRQSASRQQDAPDTDEHHSPAETWKLLPKAMQSAGLVRKDILPLLGGDFTEGGLAAYLDADPSHTLGTLISAAKGAQ